MKKKEEKREIRVLICHYIDNSSFEGDLNKIIRFLQELPEKIKESYLPNGNLDYLDGVYRYSIEINKGYDDSYDEFEVVGYRWETDEEFENRLESNRKASESAKKAAKTKKIQQEEQERKEFERLKKIYGGK